MFYREDLGARRHAMPMLITEDQARLYIGTCYKRVDTAIAKIKKGAVVKTRYANFTAKLYGDQ